MLALLVTASGTYAGAESRSATSGVIDRTFSCTPVALYSGVRQIDVVVTPRGSPGRRGGLLSDLSGGYISVISGLQRQPGAELVQVSARPEPRWQNTTLPPGVYANARRCRPAGVLVPLSSKGLPGPPATFEQNVDCEVRGRVLIRVRAELQTPAAWGRANPPYSGVRRNVDEAKIAVRSERTRRPIGLLALDAAGETRLWVSSGCG
jgi:hypothetical protein